MFIFVLLLLLIFYLTRLRATPQRAERSIELGSYALAVLRLNSTYG